MTVLNYFLVGWFDDALDHFYLPSWKVFVSLLVVFNLVGGAALAVLRYRTGEQQQQQRGGGHQGGLLASLAQNFKWTPMLAVFFGGLSFHVGLALLAHLLHVDMQWGATAKEKEDSNFFHEVPKILKTFKYLYVLTCRHLPPFPLPPPNLRVPRRTLVLMHLSSRAHVACQVSFRRPPHRRYDLPLHLGPPGLDHHRLHRRRAHVRRPGLARPDAARAQPVAHDLQLLGFSTSTKDTMNFLAVVV